MKNIVLLAVISISILGCTNIAQPTATRSLVVHGIVTPTSSVDPSLNKALSNFKAGAKILIEHEPVMLGDRYLAATGLTCRKLLSKRAGDYIYCLNTLGSWFKVKRVISEYSDTTAAEVSL